MVDPYQPPLDDFAYEEDEIAVINLALASEKPWDYVPGTAAEITALKSAKTKILNLHLQRHGCTCCYCRTNLKGAGPFMTDREHILPKSNPAYRALSYTLWNLAAACKRCNMQFKRSGDDFVIDCDNATALAQSDNYRFVHPNFDLWDDHLTRLAVQVNAKNIVKIICRDTDKAAYTYGFFHMKDLEIESFDAAQGLRGRNEESAAVMELRKLVQKFGQ
ncbi:hypothetical protein J4E05_23420 [Thalassospira sp. NFXS8]|jgi:hypothetical protein|uniref:HNH nuclease domain-containing protein n=1 Tax=Thalassospira profundimaris TaxID=502049 RepID=A0A367WKP4_9PROT|nr:hypothetical protein [Thalassospira profundimaris]RCK42026.1 hypothetical protein TH25_23240 [Thalassospira profundimaris]